MSWELGLIANGVIAIAYLAIASAIMGPLLETKQLRSNPLGVATAAIFYTCAVHHGSHALHLLGPTLGFEVHEGEALRVAFNWHQVGVDVVSAAVGVYYWSLRHAYAPLVRGAKLFEDVRERQRQALEINDNIVQGLSVAHMALMLDDARLSREALEHTLDKARGIISDLLGEVDFRGSGSGQAIGEGDLVRSRPAVVMETLRGEKQRATVQRPSSGSSGS
jgi:hypothetical protein